MANSSREIGAFPRASGRATGATALSALSRSHTAKLASSSLRGSCLCAEPSAEPSPTDLRRSRRRLQGAVEPEEPSGELPDADPQGTQHLTSGADGEHLLETDGLQHQPFTAERQGSRAES
jgi:hypothetical protein